MSSVKEAVRYKEAFEFVWNLINGRVLISKSTIKQIYCLVLPNKRDDYGVYRRILVNNDVS